MPDLGGVPPSVAVRSKFTSLCCSRSSCLCRMSSGYFAPPFPVPRAREKCELDPRL
uniref:Uncharacterized protein n=1 Tax=Anser cygnoides TaxID=8845 RepID=A0A8B9DZW8_ANSCY